MQIAVVGMHRSGTSAITHLIHAMGAWLGDDDLIMPPHAVDNPDGYWERTTVVAANVGLHSEVLPDVEPSRTWFEISGLRPIEPGQVSAAALARVRDEIAALDANAPWAIKDPRLCLTLPVWRSLLPRALYVLVVRHPLEVALSLNRRANEPLPIGLGLALWEKYMTLALRALDGAEVLAVSHARLIGEPWCEAQRMHGWLASHGASLTLPDREAVEGVVKPTLHRSRLASEAVERMWLSVQQAELFRALETFCAEAPAMIPPSIARDIAIPDARIAEFEQVAVPGSSRSYNPSPIIDELLRIEAAGDSIRSLERAVAALESATVNPGPAPASSAAER